MSRRSSIEELPPEIREAINAAIREGATIDEIVIEIRAMGGEASRSAVGRYKKKAEEVGARLQQARQVADIWVEKIGHEPEGKMGRMAIELVRTLAFNAAMDANAGEMDVGAEETMLLAKALQHLASARKTDFDTHMRIRRELADQLDAAVTEAEAAGEKGLSAERVAQLRRDFLGVR